MQIPQVWMMATGLNSERACADDATLADLDWSPTKGYGFMLPEVAAQQGIDPTSIAVARENATGVVQQYYRDIRDTILGYTDVFVLADRWAAYSAEDQAAISTYRQALRDVTSQDPFNILWPEIPQVMIGIKPEVDDLF
jgi:hypothetical protein